MVRSLVRRLRRTFENLLDSEAELIVAVKDNTESSNLRQKLTQDLREAFERARSDCRTHYGRATADRAGFPTRIAVNTSALERQAKVVCAATIRTAGHRQLDLPVARSRQGAGRCSESCCRPLTF